MVEQKPLLRLSVFLVALLAYFTASVPAMSYEEPEYNIVKKTDVYEVRHYKKRTVAEIKYGEEDSGFGALFDYISGSNKGSKEVEMTIPVTQSKEIDTTVRLTPSASAGKMSMSFFLPKQYSKQNAPEPNDERVKIIELPEEYFAVISYSGFASDSNFEDYRKKLKAALDKDGMVIKGPPIKATYNSPFTPPLLRRNEAMYLLEWNQLIHPLSFELYWLSSSNLCPTPVVVHPQLASMMCDGQSTARSLSLIEFLKEWITNPLGTLGFSHLFTIADAELRFRIAKPSRAGNPVQRITASHQVTEILEIVRVMFRLFGMLLVGQILSGIADIEGARAGNWNKTTKE